MTEDKKEELKSKILMEIEKTNQKILDLEDMTKPISPENSLGRITRMDAINNKSVSEAALRTTQKKLTKLKMSLSKLDKPDFGICANCKQPIQEARLLFMPESSTCVRCAGR